MKEEAEEDSGNGGGEGASQAQCQRGREDPWQWWSRCLCGEETRGVLERREVRQEVNEKIVEEERPSRAAGRCHHRGREAKKVSTKTAIEMDDRYLGV